MQGVDPRKMKTVCILSLKRLYDLKSTGKMKRTVLLHELAHAVHDQIYNFDNPFIENAYQQAMTRELYRTIAVGEFGPREVTLYAATNSTECFAELSCAYLDQLDYTPRTPEDLKNYDSVGYELMQKAWGKLEDIKKEKEKESKPKKK